MRRNIDILLVHHGLGDVLMALPLLRACRGNLESDGKLIVFVKSNLEKGLLEKTFIAEDDRQVEVRVFERKGFRSLVHSALEIRRMHPRMVLAPHASMNVGMSLFVRLLGAKHSVGPRGRWTKLGYKKQVHRRHDLHKVRHYLQFAECAGISAVEDFDVSLSLPDEIRTRANNNFPGKEDGQKWIFLAPGSGIAERHKRWPINSFARLAQTLLDSCQDTRIAVFGNPVERELLESVVDEIRGNRNRIVVLALPDIEEALAALSEADCLVAGCAGAGHMAAAVGVPVVGLFGPTNPGFTGPFSKKLYVVRSAIECSPCYCFKFYTGCGDPQCMKQITVDDVFKTIKDCIAGKPPSDIPALETKHLRHPPSKSADKLSGL